MIVIERPQSMDGNEFAGALLHINPQAVHLIEGPPENRCLWDESVAPAPDETALSDALTAYTDKQQTEQARTERCGTEAAEQCPGHSGCDGRDQRGAGCIGFHSAHRQHEPADGGELDLAAPGSRILPISQSAEGGFHTRSER